MRVEFETIPARGPVAMAAAGLARLLNRAVAFCLKFVDDFFDERHIRGVDFGLCVIAAGWVWAITFNPDVMGRLAYAGLSFMSRQSLVGIFAVLALAHFAGFLTPQARTVRIFTLWAAGWVWIVIGSFMSHAVTTGGPTYLVVGFIAWIAVVRLSRREG